MNNHTHLSLGCSDSSPARVDLLVDGGEEVLRYPQSILQEGEVWVVLGSVFQQVLKHEHKHTVTNTVAVIIPKTLYTLKHRNNCSHEE